MYKYISTAIISVTFVARMVASVSVAVETNHRQSQEVASVALNVEFQQQKNIPYLGNGLVKKLQQIPI